MAYVRTAADPEGLRLACQVADATEITVYDAEHPIEAGQQFVQAVVSTARGTEETFDLTSSDWKNLNDEIVWEAEIHGDTVKFVIDLGPVPRTAKTLLAIENHYDGDVVRTRVNTVLPLPMPDQDDEAAREEWEQTWIYPHTGTGRTEGDSAYFVEIVECDEPALLGVEFEFGI